MALRLIYDQPKMALSEPLFQRALLTMQNQVKLMLCITVHEELNGLAPTTSQTCFINVTLAIEPGMLLNMTLLYQTIPEKSLCKVVHSNTLP